MELRLDGMAESSNTTSAYIFPIGLGKTTRLTSTKSVVTYAGVSANLYIAKIQSVPDDVNSGWQFRVGAGALLGANIGPRLNVQAAYYLVPSIGGFALSGLNLSAHVALIQF